MALLHRAPDILVRSFYTSFTLSFGGYLYLAARCRGDITEMNRIMDEGTGVDGRIYGLSRGAAFVTGLPCRVLFKGIEVLVLEGIAVGRSVRGMLRE